MLATLDDQSAVLALWYVVNCSLSSYYKLVEYFGDAQVALSATLPDWQQLDIHKAHLERLSSYDKIQAFLSSVTDDLAKDSYRLLTTADSHYPSLLNELYDPPPVLFYRGDVMRLSDPQIAIVGSRTPSQYAIKVTFDLAQYLVQAGFVVTSGLAQGVDTHAHTGALAQYLPEYYGKTVGVMGTGIDVNYPKSNQSLFAQIIETGGCLVTELLPQTPASKHTFPRRNRLVAGLSLATVVSEAALKSGSLITARLANEQGKQVFAIPSRIDNPNAEGCHHLIREGATLIYHPNQLLEDLPTIAHQSNNTERSLVTKSAFDSSVDRSVGKAAHVATPQKQATAPTAAVPEHLQTVYHALSDTPTDLDTLVDTTNLPASALLAQLTELEIFGLVYQVGGRYAK